MRKISTPVSFSNTTNNLSQTEQVCSVCEQPLSEVKDLNQLREKLTKVSVLESPSKSSIKIILNYAQEARAHQSL